MHAVSRSESRIMWPRIHAAARRRDRMQILAAAPMKTAPNVPNKGARRGAKCASTAQQGPRGAGPRAQNRRWAGRKSITMAILEDY